MKNEKKNHDSDDLPVIVIENGGLSKDRYLKLSDTDIKALRLDVKDKTFFGQSVLPKESLNKFSCLRKQFRDMLKFKAIRTELGYIVPPASLKEVLKFLDNIKEEWYKEKLDLLGKITAINTEVIQKFEAKWNEKAPTDLKKAFQSGLVTDEQIERGVFFHIYPFSVGRLQSSDATSDVAKKVGLQYSVMRNNMWTKVLSDIAGLCGEQYKRIEKSISSKLVLGSKYIVSTKSVNAMEKAINKFSSFKFIDGRIEPIADEIKGMIAKINKLDNPDKKTRMFLDVLSACSSYNRLENAILRGTPLIKSVKNKSTKSSNKKTKVLPTTVSNSNGMAAGWLNGM